MSTATTNKLGGGGEKPVQSGEYDLHTRRERKKEKQREKRELKAPLSIIFHRMSAMNELSKNGSKRRTMFQHFYSYLFIFYFWLPFVGELMTCYRDDIVSFNVQLFCHE